jgi:DNA modification methylase
MCTSEVRARRQTLKNKGFFKFFAKFGPDVRSNGFTAYKSGQTAAAAPAREMVLTKAIIAAAADDGHASASEELAPVEIETLCSSVDARNQLNDLTAREWIPETVSVWNQRGLGAGHPDAQIERQHPAPFSFTDVGRLVRFFTKRGQTVLDPFVGVGSTLKACAIDGRNGIGIELNPTFAELCRKRLDVEVRDMFSSVSNQQIMEGDARELVARIPDESVDFVVTSPPYWSILKKVDHKVRQERIEKGLARHYGDDPRDLGKIDDYEDFLKVLCNILGGCVRTLKSGKYMAVIVSDFRDKSRYVMFHSDLAHELKSHGLEMRGLTVLYQRHKKIFPYGYPYSFVPNVHNQYILILQKSEHG